MMMKFEIPIITYNICEEMDRYMYTYIYMCVLYIIYVNYM